MKTASIYEINKNWDSAISNYKDIINKSPNKKDITIIFQKILSDCVLQR